MTFILDTDACNEANTDWQRETIKIQQQISKFSRMQLLHTRKELLAVLCFMCYLKHSLLVDGVSHYSHRPWMSVFDWVVQHRPGKTPQC